MKKGLVILIVLGCYLTSSAQDIDKIYQDPLFENYVKLTDDLKKLGYSPNNDSVKTNPISAVSYESAINDMQSVTSYEDAKNILSNYNIPNGNEISLKLQDIQDKMSEIATKYSSLQNLSSSDFGKVLSSNLDNFKQNRAVDINSISFKSSLSIHKISLGITNQLSCVTDYVDDVDLCDGFYALGVGVAAFGAGVAGGFTVGAGAVGTFVGAMFVNNLVHDSCLKTAAKDYKKCQGYL